LPAPIRPARPINSRFILRIAGFVASRLRGCIQPRNLRSIPKPQPRHTASNPKDETEETTMNGYKPNTPRTAFGLAAVALTAITMGVFVVAPATFDSVGDHDVTSLVASSANAATSAAKPEVLYTIDVVATRAPAIEARNSMPRHKQQG
jgi:hypothetical protein